MDSIQQQEVQIRKRVTCEERAFNVVLRLLDNPVTADYLGDACQLITPSHYADVVEERSLAKLCGYSLCGNKLDKVSKQRYQISTKNNMVYDITERKKFCSNLCFKSSQYLEKQISSTPVWARDNEPPVNFEFLQVPSESCSMGDALFLPLPQTEVKKAVQTLEKLDKSAPHEKKPSEATSTNVDLSSENSSNLLSDVVDRMAQVKISYAKEVDGINVDFSKEEHTIDKLPDSKEEHTIDKLPDSKEEHTIDKLPDSKEEHTIDKLPDSRESPDDTDEIARDSTRSGSVKVCMGDNTDSPLSRNVELKDDIEPTNCGDSCEKVESDAKGSDVKADAGRQAGETTEEYVMRLLERKKHLLGQLADIQQNQEQSLTPGGSANKDIDSDEEEEEEESNHLDTSKSIDKPARLSIEEISPQKATPVSPGSGEFRNPRGSPAAGVRLQPLNAIARVMEEWLSRDTFKLLNMCPTGYNDIPSTDTDFDKNYAKLCRKVAEDEQDFENLLGEESVEDSNQSKRLPVPDYKKLEAETAHNELRVREFYRGSAGGGRRPKGENQSVDTARRVQLPVVDSHDQMTIRRKIVLDRLNRVIPDILIPLRLSIQDVSQPIRELVFTFSFSSKNILFKPGEWSLVGILVLKLLSLKSKQIELSFKEDSAVRYFQIILSSLGHNFRDVDQVVKEMMSFDSQT